MLAIEILRLHPAARVPLRALSESAGFDLFALLLSESGRAIKRMISVRATVAIPTGIAIRPPKGHVALVCTRSGYAKHNIFVANSPGVIDPDYTGEISVLLYNGGYDPYYIEHEHRIAQLIVVPLPFITTRLVDELPNTERGVSGFGSTGR